ncbi:MAG: hypothetical protein AMJ53_03215 [Gammaproteobacteria bacterium SG8_11]|nr:MAG: hypothetical protein AMJ53_03215 [Gammaproteobacteria bacterium SG8_11]
MLATIKENKHFFTVANFALFQVGWLVCVVAAAHHYEAVSVLSCAIIIGLHLSLLKEMKSEVKLILFSAALGFIVDSLNIAFNVFQTTQPQSLPLAPLWLVAMWMLFAICLRHSLAWLLGKPLLSGIFGAVCAPLAYYAGASIGALQLPQNDILMSLSAIGLAWALVTPLLFVMANHFDRSTQSLN